jgi:hypothetical protein
MSSFYFVNHPTSGTNYDEVDKAATRFFDFKKVFIAELTVHVYNKGEKAVASTWMVKQTERQNHKINCLYKYMKLYAMINITNIL